MRSGDAVEGLLPGLPLEITCSRVWYVFPTNPVVSCQTRRSRRSRAHRDSTAMKKSLR